MFYVVSLATWRTLRLLTPIHAFTDDFADAGSAEIVVGRVEHRVWSSYRLGHTKRPPRRRFLDKPLRVEKFSLLAILC
jgi:hypothetical protein